MNPISFIPDNVYNIAGRGNVYTAVGREQPQTQHIKPGDTVLIEDKLYICRGIETMGGCRKRGVGFLLKPKETHMSDPISTPSGLCPPSIHLEDPDPSGFIHISGPDLKYDREIWHGINEPTPGNFLSPNDPRYVDLETKKATRTLFSGVGYLDLIEDLNEEDY